MKRTAGTVLISETDIHLKVSEMGGRISEDYNGGSLMVVGILKGSFIFIADLIRSIDPSILIEVEFMTFEFDELLAIGVIVEDISGGPAQVDRRFEVLH